MTESHVWAATDFLLPLMIIPIIGLISIPIAAIILGAAKILGIKHNSDIGEMSLIVCFTTITLPVWAPIYIVIVDIFAQILGADFSLRNLFYDYLVRPYVANH
jgi:hypothetical protein